MSLTAEELGATVSRDRRGSRIAGTQFNHVMFWAWVGVIWMIPIAYSWGMWVVSGQFTPTVPVNAEPWRITVFRILEVAIGFCALLSIWWFVYLPKRRTGQLSINGLVVLATPLLWYQDPLLNYIVPYGVLSSIFINFGSWSAHFPGATAPNINLMPEPFPFQMTVYLALMAGIIISITWAMRKWKERFPRAGFWSLFGVAMTAGMVYDLVLEIPAVWLQVWAYPGAIRSLSLWPGTPHQFPLYEPVMLGFTFAIWSSVLFFKDDQGRILCERGLERLRFTARRKGVVRYLALLGLFQSIYFFTYNAPTWWVTMRGDAWPDTFPAHLTNGICGARSDVICPGDGVPYLRRKNGLVITPDGQLAGELPE